jgi:peptide/nickel transport system permease protein
MLGLNAEPETVAALRRELGLEGSVVERYLAWVGGMLTGDFGVSYTYRVPVAELVAARLWVSLPLTLYALALTILIAFPVGLLAAANRGRAADVAVMGTTQLGIAVPNFWFAMLLVLVFAIQLQWFSAGGISGLGERVLGRREGADAARHRAGAAAGVDPRPGHAVVGDRDAGPGLHPHGARQGLSQRQAVVGHALRNALIPVMTIIGLQFSFLLAGAIIIENVFFLPGLGRLIFQGITQRDLIVVESVTMLLVFAVILVTFLVDVAYAVIDPRLRHRA